MARKDYDINDCYNHFISKASDDKENYEQELLQYENSRDYLHSVLNATITDIKHKFDIDLHKYSEFENKVYVEDCNLYNTAIKYVKMSFAINAK